MAVPSEMLPQHMELDYPELHPKPRQVLFMDPRPNSYHDMGICGFSERQTKGPYDVLESMCGCGFLGNSFGAVLDVEVNGRPMRFTNAEAAFQALRFSNHAQHFENLSGDEAFQRGRDFSGRGSEDPEHGGYGTSWKAMQAVLKAKFKVNTPLGIALEQTGDDFLLCHSSDYDPDATWSNGGNGQGMNWLGMQLMLIRSNRTGWKRWATFIQTQVDTLTGRPLYNNRNNHFQDAVKGASEALNAVLGHHQDALPSIAQQPAAIAAFSSVEVMGGEQQRDIIRTVSGETAGQQRDILAEIPAEQLRDVLTGYDQFQQLDAMGQEVWNLPAEAGCVACSGTGIDFMGHPCACSEADFLQQQADLLQHNQEQYPDLGEDAALNGATLNGATLGQDYR